MNVCMTLYVCMWVNEWMKWVNEWMKERKEGREGKGREGKEFIQNYEGCTEWIPKNLWIFLLHGKRITFFAAFKICFSVCQHHSQHGHSHSFLLVFPTKYIYIKSTTTVYVPSLELGLFHPLSRQRVCPPPPGTKGGMGHTRLRVRGWESPNSDDLREKA